MKTRKPRAPKGAKLIKLTQGKYAIVDEDMFEELNQFKWFCHDGYARRNSPYVDGKRHAIHMSHVVANPPVGFQCDHRSTNRLDNRRSNLRVATPSQNAMNKRAYKNNTTGVKGVDFRIEAKHKYRARIQLDKRSIMIGRFKTLEKAAAAYLEAAKQYHGEFARIS